MRHFIFSCSFLIFFFLFFIAFAVIDFCLTKNLVCDTDTHYTHLQLEWASHSNCTQRKGKSKLLFHAMDLFSIRFYWICTWLKFVFDLMKYINQGKSVESVFTPPCSCSYFWFLGRAGRVSQGRAYVMVTRDFYENYLCDYSLPEMQVIVYSGR